MKIDANRIRTLREARGWSQEHLASVAGLSPRTVQRLESEGKASHESRMAVAAALEIDAAQLLETAAIPTTTSPSTATNAADRAKIILWIVSILLAVAMFQIVAGFVLGKDAALRDNRINEACKANPAECQR